MRYIFEKRLHCLDAVDCFAGNSCQTFHLIALGCIDYFSKKGRHLKKNANNIGDYVLKTFSSNKTLTNLNIFIRIEQKTLKLHSF